MKESTMKKTEAVQKTGNVLIRVITLPPLMAALALCILRWQAGLFPGNSLWAGLFFLSVLPLMAYPFCFAVPALRKKGRPLQRKMAVAFSVAGYLGGTVYCLAEKLWGMELTLFLTYLFSGVVIAVLSSCFHFKCSGHASGMAGPITLLGMQVSPLCFLGYGLLVPVFSSSIKLQRHTREELVAGALTPAVLLVLLMYGI
ncbi:MAG: hypothetical protein IKM05_04510 [Clostridia bacterium]|nr:hypothetical protein [Clostridia bacterium]MBR6753273.1 hypothetical protein [Clostridia bacterium]